MRTFNVESETILSRHRKYIFAFVSIITITIIIYSNTFHASWHFDDKKFLTQKDLHPAVLAWSEVNRIVFQDIFDRPVASLSLELNYFFGKDDVLGYHLINLSIHIISSI
ncbi:hypothetical protein ACFL0H_09430, partial [Thermodesulfobacteriota bacterium]